MPGRAALSLRFSVLVALATPAVALAEDGGEQAQRAPRQPPKLLGSGQDAAGVHTFLFGNKGEPSVVVMGKAGELEEYEVLGIKRYPGKFVVDTLEKGEIIFDTNEGTALIRGSMGFRIPNNPKFKEPQEFNQAPDPAVFLQA